MIKHWRFLTLESDDSFRGNQSFDSIRPLLLESPKSYLFGSCAPPEILVLFARGFLVPIGIPFCRCGVDEEIFRSRHRVTDICRIRYTLSKVFHHFHTRNGSATGTSHTLSLYSAVRDIGLTVISFFGGSQMLSILTEMNVISAS